MPQPPQLHPMQSRDLPTWTKVVPCICGWWACAVLITLTLKSILGSPSGHAALFPFPFALTALSNCSAGIMAYTLDMVLRLCFFSQDSKNEHEAEIGVVPGALRQSLRSDEIWKLVGVGAMQGFEIGCFNKALAFISVSRRTMLVSINLLFVTSVAVPCGLEQLSWRKFIAILLLITGGLLQALSTWNHRNDSSTSTFAIQGSMLALFAMLLGGFRWAVMQCFLKRGDADSHLRHISKLQMVWRVSPSFAATCALFALIFEPLAWSKLDSEVLLTSGSVGLLVAILMASEFMLVQLTSAVALNVAASLHNIPVALAGVIFFHDQIHMKAGIGFCAGLLGAMVYTLDRYSSESPTSTESQRFDLLADGASPLSAEDDAVNKIELTRVAR
jgi:drug/metabolite transporter (DMT)-like permease